VSSPSGPRLRDEPFVPLLLVIAGAALGFAVVFVDYPFSDSWDGDARAFVGKAETLLWFLFLFGQVGLWLALQPAAWRAFRAVPTGGRGTTTSFGLIIVGGCIAVVVSLGFTVNREYPLPGHGAKLVVVTTLGLLAATPALLCVWRLHRVIAALTPDANGRATLIGYADEQDAHPLTGLLRLRELLDSALVILGLIIGAAILSTGAFRHAVLAWDPAQEFPVEYVLLYGAFFTLLLALVYVPTYLRLQAAGRQIIAAYVPIDPGTADLAEAYEKRQKLTTLLRLDASVASSFVAGAAIVTPLVTSLLGVVLSPS